MAGNVHPIVQYGDPVLHRTCAEVVSFDDALAQLVEDMFASMYAADGVGLAANQIGVDAAVFVMDCPDADGERVVGHFVNPRLILPTFGGPRIDDLEGCLSVLGEHAMLERSATAKVVAVDVHGDPVTVETSGTAARCLQHESGHLKGQVYVDLLSPEQRQEILEAAGLG